MEAQKVKEGRNKLYKITTGTQDMVFCIYRE